MAIKTAEEVYQEVMPPKSPEWIKVMKPHLTPFIIKAMEAYADQFKVKDKTSIEERAKAFASSIVPYVDKYGKPMCREFFDYWSEKSQSGRKMRFEMEKTWDIEKRLARWQRNNEEKKPQTQPRIFKDI